MDKKILIEIARIHEMMGVKKELLLENGKPIFKKISRLIDDLFTSKKPIKSTINKQMLDIDGVEVSPSDYQKIRNVLINPDKYDNLTLPLKKILGKIISKDEYLTNYLYQDFFQNVLDNGNFKNEMEIYQSLANYMKTTNQNLETAMNSLGGNNDELINEVLISKVQKKLLDLKSNKFVAEVSKKIDGQVNNYVAGIENSMLKVEKVKPYWAARKPLAWNKTVDIIHAWLRKRKSWEDTLDQKSQEIIDLVGGLAYEYSQKKEVKNAADFVKDIQTRILTLQEKGSSEIPDFEEVYNSIEKKLKSSGVNQVDLTKIMKDLREGKAWDVVQKLEPSRGDIITDFFVNSTGNAMLKELRNNKSEFFSRIGKYMSVGIFKTAQEIKDHIRLKGIVKGSAETYIYMMISSKVILPIFYGIGLGLYNGMVSYFDPKQKGKGVWTSVGNEILLEWREQFLGQLERILSGEGEKFGGEERLIDSYLPNGGWQRLYNTVKFLIPANPHLDDLIIYMTTPFEAGSGALDDQQTEDIENALKYNDCIENNKIVSKECFEIWCKLPVVKKQYVSWNDELKVGSAKSEGDSESCLYKYCTTTRHFVGLPENTNQKCKGICPDWTSLTSLTPSDSSLVIPPTSIIKYEDPSKDYSNWENFVVNNRLSNESSVSDTTYGIYKANGLKWEYCDKKKTFYKSGSDYENNCK